MSMTPAAKGSRDKVYLAFINENNLSLNRSYLKLDFHLNRNHSYHGTGNYICMTRPHHLNESCIHPDYHLYSPYNT